MEHNVLDQVEQYLRRLEDGQTSSPNTVAANLNDLMQFCQFLDLSTARGIGSQYQDGLTQAGGWAGVTRSRLTAFVVFLKEKGYATTTVARKIAAMKSFFHYLTLSGVIDVDPTDSLDSPRIDKVAPRGLSTREVAGLLDQRHPSTSPDDLRDDAMLRVLYSSGLRVSEMVSLNLDDVDVSSGYVRCVSRNGRERIIPLDGEAVLALRQYLDSARVMLVRRRDEVALFVNRRGDRLTRQGFWLILKERARDAGLAEHVTPQSLRHSFAIRLLHDNTDLRSVQLLLGHANITTTQIYSQFATSNQEGDAAPIMPPDAAIARA